jgi:ABC-type nitrate/sulfonate/bicarbonate transport system permease component
VLVECGPELQAHAVAALLENPVPSALPTIFVGVRLGMIFALINIVGVEFLINFGGLGQLVNELAERYDLPGTYAAICFVILVSVLFFIGTERIERWLRPGT